MRSDKSNITVRYGDAADREELYRLWQACFHDSDAFTDYYFDYYFRENRVLLLEDEGRLQAMLHLNPYRLMVREKQVDSFYIVGVATDENYRHRGAMTSLLQKVFEDTRRRELPFVYLMPADEAIYRPFQFAYIYAQRVEAFHWVAEDANSRDGLVSAASVDEAKRIVCNLVVTKKDREKLADRINEYLRKHYDMYPLRDEHYYERLRMENRADGGELMQLYATGQWIGALSYARENVVEVREIFCRPEWRECIIQWMREYFQGMKGEILPLMPGGFFTEQGRTDPAVNSFMRPIIMGRIVHLQQWMQLFEPYNSDFSLCMEIRDDWIEANNGIWLWKTGNGQVIFERTKQQPDLCVNIATLMQWMTGYRSVGELEASGAILIRTDCRDVLEKISVLQKIFINEIV